MLYKSFVRKSKFVGSIENTSQETRSRTLMNRGIYKTTPAVGAAVVVGAGGNNLHHGDCELGFA